MTMPRRLTPWLGAFTVVLVVALPGSAEEPAEVPGTDLVERCAEALGGEAWAEIHSLELRGTYTSFSRSTPFRLLRQRPDLYRFDHNEAAAPLTIAHDGEASWWQTGLPVISRATWPVEPPVPYQRDFALDAEFDMPCVAYRAKGHAVEPRGEISFEGEPFLELVITRRGADERWLLDPETHRPALRLSQSTYHGYITEQRQHFSDYREVNGVRIPYRVETEIGNDYLEMQVESVEVNPTVDDAVFSRPLPAGMELLADLPGRWRVTIEHRDDPAFHAERVTPWESVETTSVIRPAFGGSLLEEDIEIDTPRPRTVRRAYSWDRFLERYRVTVFDSVSQYLDVLEGHLAEGRLTVSNVDTGTPTRVYQQAFHLRETLYDLTPDRFLLDREVSLDGGETWRLDLRFTYQRITITDVE